MKRKWYLSTWLISILFALWFLIVPPIIGIVLLVKQMQDDKERIKMGWGDVEKTAQRKEKAESELNACKEKVSACNKELSELQERLGILHEIDACKEKLCKLQKQLGILHEVDDATKETQRAELELQAKIDTDKSKIEVLEQKIEKKQSAIKELDERINDLKDKIIVLDDELLYQDFGFYETKYDLESSAAYKLRLQEIRQQQKDMIKQKTACDFYDGWTVNGSVTEGRKMTNKQLKLTINAFNQECDSCIDKVKFNNVESMKKRICRAYERLNEMNTSNRINITNQYLNLKLEELFLAYEYAQKKEEEKEEQAQIREQMREEEKVRREIEKEKAKIEKEETHFRQEIENLKSRAESSEGNNKEQLEDKISELEAKLALVEKEKRDVFNREQNTRAGYVYIISNIGSFGDNVYKIGLTRRLVPEDRVRELSSASVPFTFDIHAMIFSEDAPKLEAALHEAFDHKRVNRVNGRKEFFRLRLEEIEEEVKKNHNAVVEFTKIAEAKEYRESQSIYKKELLAQENHSA